MFVEPNLQRTCSLSGGILSSRTRYNGEIERSVSIKSEAIVHEQLTLTDVLYLLVFCIRVPSSCISLFETVLTKK